MSGTPRTPPKLLSAARAAFAATPGGGDLDRILAPLDKIRSSAEKVAAGLFKDTDEQDESAARSATVAAAEGLCAGVEAAARIAGWVGRQPPEEGDLGVALNNCAQSLHIARPTVRDGDLNDVETTWWRRAAGTTDGDHVVDGVLRDWAGKQDSEGNGVLASPGAADWPATRRLLTWFLPTAASYGPAPHFEEAPPLFKTEVRALLYGDGFNWDGEPAGATRFVRSEVRPEGYSGAYLDPVVLGLTHLDEAFLETVRNALVRAGAGMRRHLPGDEGGRYPTLRVAIWPTGDLPANFINNEGEARLVVTPSLREASAGGLLAAAIPAAAERVPLDPGVTASFIFEPDPGDPSKVRAAGLGEGVRSLPAKLLAAAGRGVTRVFVHREDYVLLSDGIPDCEGWTEGDAVQEQDGRLRVKRERDGDAYTTFVFPVDSFQKFQDQIRDYGTGDRHVVQAYLAAIRREAEALPAHFPKTAEFGKVRTRVRISRQRRRFDDEMAAFLEKERLTNPDAGVAYLLRHGDAESQPAANGDGPVVRVLDFDNDLLHRFKDGILIGDPGVGKSFLVRWIGLFLGRERETGMSRGEPLAVTGATEPPFVRGYPVPVRLRAVGAELEEIKSQERTEPWEREATTLNRAIVRVAARGRTEPGNDEAGRLRGFLYERLGDPSTVLLLDGWDEVEEGHHDDLREAIKEWHKVDHDRRARTLFTSRSAGYERPWEPRGNGTDPEDFEAELLGFDPEQAEEFIRGYFAADVAAADSLVGVLESPQIRGVAGNPLLAGYLCDIFRRKLKAAREQGRPEAAADEVRHLRRVEIYGLMVGQLLKQAHREYGGPTLPGDLAQERELLAAFAYRTFEAGAEWFTDSLDAAEAYYRTACEEVGVSTGEGLDRTLREAFLDRLASWSGETGLLVRLDGAGESADRSRRYLFAHLTLHEYLTAVHLADRVRRERVSAISQSASAIVLLDERTWNPRWLEVAALSAGCLRPELGQTFVMRLADERRDNFRHWRLSVAARCVRELADSVAREQLGGTIAAKLLSCIQQQTQNGMQQPHLIEGLFNLRGIKSAESEFGKTATRSPLKNAWEFSNHGPVANRELIAAALAVSDPERNPAKLQLIQSLGRSQSDATARVLLDVLERQDMPDDLRIEALCSLGKLAAKSGAASIISICGDAAEQESVRIAAADALGRIGDRAAIPVLSELLERLSSETTDCFRIAIALAELDATQEKALEVVVRAAWAPNLVDPLRMRAQRVLAQQGVLHERTPLLLQFVQEREGPTFRRAIALQMLCRVDRTGAEREAKAIAFDVREHPVLRASAIACPVIFKMPSGTLVARKLLHRGRNESQSIREVSAMCCGWAGDRSAESVLLQVAASPFSGVKLRKTAVYALSKIPDPAGGVRRRVILIILSVVGLKTPLGYAASRALTHDGAWKDRPGWLKATVDGIFRGAAAWRRVSRRVISLTDADRHFRYLKTPDASMLRRGFAALALIPSVAIIMSGAIVMVLLFTACVAILWVLTVPPLWLFRNYVARRWWDFAFGPDSFSASSSMR